VALGTAFGGPGAQASGNETLQEVVVTGERQAQTWHDTASSVAVITGEMNESLAGADRIEQIMALIPNLQLGSGAAGPTIRGQDSTGVLRDLPAFLGGTRPRATLQVDGRAVSFNEFVFGLTSVWDVDRVEVFRSPQTTTQGRNSIAGAIFIETRDPEYAWNGRVRMLGGNYDTWQASGVITGPIVDQQLAFRIAGDLRTSHTSSEIGKTIVGADPNEDDYGVLRLKVLAEPTALPGMRLLTTFAHVQSQMPSNESVRAPFHDREDRVPTFGVFSNTINSLTSVLDYELAPESTSTTTVSWGDASIVRHATPGLGQTDTHSNDLAIESILNLHPADAVHMLGGVHYLISKLNQAINLSAVLGSGAFDDRQESLGVFGEAKLQLAPRFSATVGIRYERDSQDREGALGSPATGFPIDFDKTFNAWLPKLSAAYEFTPGVKVGIQIQRAFNPGGTTLNLDTGDQDDFLAEALWNYEVFARASLADGRVTLGANAFYNDFTDAQRARLRAYTVPGGATAFWAEIDNVPASESHGVEIELGWFATNQLSLRAGIGLLETQIVRTDNPADPLRGNEFQRSPAFTGAAAIDWRPAERWHLSAQIRHNSGYFSDDANTPNLHITANTVLDARASYDRESWSVFSYVRNACDVFYMMELNSTSRGTAGDPREFGFGIEARF
jgi:outer membrane receptor protein involved in Fe transport